MAGRCQRLLLRLFELPAGIKVLLEDRRLERELAEKLGTKVAIQHRDCGRDSSQFGVNGCNDCHSGGTIPQVAFTGSANVPRGSPAR